MCFFKCFALEFHCWFSFLFFCHSCVLARTIVMAARLTFALAQKPFRNLQKNMPQPSRKSAQKMASLIEIWVHICWQPQKQTQNAIKNKINSSNWLKDTLYIRVNKTAMEVVTYFDIVKFYFIWYVNKYLIIFSAFYLGNDWIYIVI